MTVAVARTRSDMTIVNFQPVLSTVAETISTAIAPVFLLVGRPGGCHDRAIGVRVRGMCGGSESLLGTLAIAHPAPVDAVSPLRQVLLPAAR